MRLEQVLATWAGDGGTTRRVEGRESMGEGFASRHTEGSSDEGAPRLVVERVPGRDITDRVAGIVDDLAEGDLAVLILPAPLDQVSPVTILGSLAPTGGHLVGVHDLADRLGRTALVITRGPATSVRTVTGVDTIDLGPDATASVVDEWLVVGAVQRAQLEALQRQGSGHREEVGLLRQERNTALDDLKAERAAHAATKAAARTQASTAGTKVRRVAQLLRDNPVEGGRRLGRAGLRRLGR